MLAIMATQAIHVAIKVISLSCIPVASRKKAKAGVLWLKLVNKQLNGYIRIQGYIPDTQPYAY